jgi:hypothetical protein
MSFSDEQLHQLRELMAPLQQSLNSIEERVERIEREVNVVYISALVSSLNDSFNLLIDSGVENKSTRPWAEMKPWRKFLTIKGICQKYSLPISTN